MPATLVISVIVSALQRAILRPGDCSRSRRGTLLLARPSCYFQPALDVKLYHNEYLPESRLANSVCIASIRAPKHREAADLKPDGRYPEVYSVDTAFRAANGNIQAGLTWWKTSASWSIRLNGAADWLNSNGSITIPTGYPHRPGDANWVYRWQISAGARLSR